ncbi:MAG: sel1 repeat family protein [Lachnospiraceae bacterium]|nr:sel1 repeat family protein [Lachnospiraceae bacterium]
MMTVKEAREIEADFYKISNPSEEDVFLYTEAMDFLIREENRPEDMMQLGGWYYESRSFDLALKYYEMASAFQIDAADECLGYIWYYGRTGERDYEKAFRHYSRSMERGNPVSTYKVADMYKNGYFVEKDDEKYKEIIEKLYPEVKDARYVEEPLPEVFTRLARIRKEQGRPEEAADLYLRAKVFLAQRIRYHPFFGNLNIMKWLIDDLYEIIEFDPGYIDFYDLYYVLRRPAGVSFFYRGGKHELESLMEDGACVVHFHDQWFRSRDDFFKKAMLDNQKITALYADLYGFEVKIEDGDH